MDSPEFDFTRHESELALARIADTLGALVNAEARMREADLRVVTASVQRQASLTAKERIAATYNSVMARLESIDAQLEMTKAAKQLDTNT